MSLGPVPESALEAGCGGWGVGVWGVCVGGGGGGWGWRWGVGGGGEVTFFLQLPSDFCSEEANCLGSSLLIKVPCYFRFPNLGVL